VEREGEREVSLSPSLSPSLYPSFLSFVSGWGNNNSVIKT
jgi:hypothetical protein